MAAIARFKDLCIDVADAGGALGFWSDVLGLRAVAEAGHERLEGDRAQETVWLNHVAEGREVKNRVHLDVFATSVAELEASGARELQAFERWTVMAAPDGQEFCAFVRPDPPPHRLKDVVVDSQQPERIARWWQSVLGGELGSDEPRNPWWWLDGVPGAPFESIDFVQVPEAKQVKNRVHWDLTVADVQPLVEGGATLLRPKGGDIRWHVLADPDGNEFCAFEG